MKVGIGVIMMVISHFHKLSQWELEVKKKKPLTYWNSYLQNTCVDSDQITHILQTFLKLSTEILYFEAFDL